MAEVKKSSYPSKQVRAGPAPLASFEDLPSDELESPDSLRETRDVALSSYQRSRPVRGLELTSTTDFNLGPSSPRTLTASASSTPQIESDFDSQYTITPCDTKSRTPSSVKTGSLSSLVKTGRDDDRHSIGLEQKKGSVSSLLSAACDNLKSSGEESHRKGSWTDIFHSRGHSRSRSRSPQRPATQESPHSSRKLKDSPVEPNELKRKDKGTFLSLFKIGGKKSPKSVTPSPPHSPSDFSQVPMISVINGEKYLPKGHSEINLPNVKLTGSEQVQQINNEEIVSIKENKISICEDKSVQSLVDDHTSVAHSLELVSNIPEVKCEVTRESYFSPDQERGNNSLDNDKSLLKKVDELNSHVKVLEYLKERPNTVDLSSPHISVTEDDHESSESELTFDIDDTTKPELQKRNSEEDFEAETLLAQDSVEFEEYPSIEFQSPFPDICKSQIKTPTRRQRLEVTTIPIERPRSTTPINIAPLEAFIQSASPSPDTGLEKIKLSLPRDQFVSRPKSPKKGNPKSWLDFCEEGLHSPRLRKRSQGDESDLQLKTPTDITSESSDFGTDSSRKISSSSTDDTAHLIEKQWVTFEINLDEENLVKEPFSLTSQVCSANLPLEEKKMPISEIDDTREKDCHNGNNEKIVKCSCECHTCGCDCHYIFVDVMKETQTILETSKPESSKHQNISWQNDNIPASSCLCECHKQHVHMWDQTAREKLSGLSINDSDNETTKETTSNTVEFFEESFTADVRKKF